MQRTILFVLLSCLLAISAHAENWPAWRGPSGNGVSREKNLPLVWNKAAGIRWTTPLPGWGGSTPIVWNESIFLTANSTDQLLLVKLDRQTGQIHWRYEVASGEAARVPARTGTGNDRSEQKFHDLHNLATPSPVTNGEVVVAHFGNGDLVACDFSGQQLWKRNLQQDYGKYTVWWGHANSPIIYEDLVISVCMQDSLADLQPESPIDSYLVAHDLVTGAVRWKTLRNTGANTEEADAYTTPLLVEVGGKNQLVVMGGNQLDAYDPATGNRLWFLPGLVGGRTVTGPTAAEGYLFATRGMRGATFALTLEEIAKAKSSELTFRDIAWKYDQGTPDSCTPVVWGNWFFTVADDGIARCLDVETGKLKWKQRLKGDYKASPVAADGRVYFLSTSGTCTVVAAGERFQKLAENQLEDTFLASPAIASGEIFLRGRKAIYCIGN